MNKILTHNSFSHLGAKGENYIGGEKMKKWIGILGLSVFLVGCDLMGGDAEEESSSASVSESSVESSEESSAASSEASSESSSAATTPESNAGGEVSTAEFPLVPQNSELDKGITLENDPLLQQIQDKMAQTPELGIENDVAIHFTGLFLGEQGTETAQAVFIIVNRTDMAMTNIDLSISMSTVNGDVILESAPFSLTEENFGVLEPDTVMPIYLAVPIDNQESFFNITNINDVTYTIDSFEFDER